MTVDHGRDERLPLTVVDERVAMAVEAVDERVAVALEAVQVVQ